eukprot:TRINITY_DN4857_c0_g1_i1.p1 TRINITY_DN4857_c0_g1~~TRINITY_DN4857_c0_g1_i1.p1  ORF type:complete len:158 (-),score=10.70 TRINITY_DN4857_c0_g1_i1:519-992(-)
MGKSRRNSEFSEHKYRSMSDEFFRGGGNQSIGGLNLSLCVHHRGRNHRVLPGGEKIDLDLFSTSLSLRNAHCIKKKKRLAEDLLSCKNQNSQEWRIANAFLLNNGDWDSSDHFLFDNVSKNYKVHKFSINTAHIDPKLTFLRKKFAELDGFNTIYVF